MYISMYINWVNIFPSATNSLLKKKKLSVKEKKITHLDWSERVEINWYTHMSIGKSDTLKSWFAEHHPNIQQDPETLVKQHYHGVHHVLDTILSVIYI